MLILAPWSLLLACFGGEAEPPPAPALKVGTGVCLRRLPVGDPPRFGCIDEVGTWVIPPDYVLLSAPKGLVYAKKPGGGAVSIDLGATPPTILPLPEGGVWKSVGGGRLAHKDITGWALTGPDGKPLSDERWLSISGGDGTFWPACRHRQTGSCTWINAQGAPILPPTLVIAGAPQEGKAAFSDGPDSFGIADLATASLGAVRYQDLVAGEDGWSWAKGPDGWQILDRKGVASKPLADVVAVQAFTQGLGAAQVGELWGFVATDGTFAVPPRYHRVRPFSEDRAVVIESAGAPFQYIDPKGGTVGRLHFDAPLKIDGATADAFDFHEGRAAARLDGAATWGYVGPDGAWAIEPRFQSATTFDRGVALVDGKDAIRPDGTVIAPQ